MRVIRSDVMGMCFGVRDALAVIDAIDEPSKVTIHGELVHNEVVLHQLNTMGFRRSQGLGRDPASDASTVLITAHGVSDTERARLSAMGKDVIDATCPLVARAHRAARALHDQGYHVVVIGKPGHVEVQGLIGDLEHVEVVSTPSDARRIEARRIGILCQTTVPPRKASAVRQAIEAENPDADVRFVDTVCRPTKEHQRALDRLLQDVDAVVVVGGKSSNNTRELAETCRARGVPAYQVQSFEELDASWFAGLEVVGLTAGTSTLDSTIDQVHERLLEVAANAEAEADARVVAFAR